MALHSTENNCMEFVSKAKTFFLVKLNLKKAHEIKILNLQKKIWINVFSMKMSKKIIPDSCVVNYVLLNSFFRPLLF